MTKCWTLLLLLLFVGVSESFTLQSLKNRSPSHRIMTESSSLDAAASTTAADAPGKVVPTLNNWDPTNWTPKRIWNTPLFRTGSILSVLAGAAYYSTTASAGSAIALSTKAAATIHMLSFGTWFGSMGYTTFVAGLTMYKNLPRQTFGKLQSKLFPKYFMLSSICLFLQLGTVSKLLLGVRTLVFALMMTLLNQLFLEPTATKVMLERYGLENKDKQDTPEYKKLAKQFGKLHGMSSLANLLALCAGVAHAFQLGSALAGSAIA